VDAETILEAGIPAVQLRTGGFCHVDSYMVAKTLPSLDLGPTDLLILENVGNLICPAQSDTGANSNVMILSVPEGDDKPLKYPLMFRECEALVVNKADYLQIGDFDMDSLRRRAKKLNPGIKIFEVSCKTGAGMQEWAEWLLGKIGR
jgi:hydrogenase nickel incorporation protein HypB